MVKPLTPLKYVASLMPDKSKRATWLPTAEMQCGLVLSGGGMQIKQIIPYEVLSEYTQGHHQGCVRGKTAPRFQGLGTDKSSSFSLRQLPTPGAQLGIFECRAPIHE